MQFRLYDDKRLFGMDVLPILLENEAQNNLLINLATGSSTGPASDWMLATVEDNGGVAITALNVSPFNLFLYETSNSPRDDALDCLVLNLRAIGAAPLGVTAEAGLARRFTGAFAPSYSYRLHMQISAMRLDKPVSYVNAPGSWRMLEEGDLFFAPYWEGAFSEDCRAKVFTIRENHDRLLTRIGKHTHYIWEDGIAVSQAVHGRSTPNGAVINGVYTPPHYRQHGYAASVVSVLSNALLERGKSFCCLYADADNPASTGLYHKLGYYDVCRLEDIRFDNDGILS